MARNRPIWRDFWFWPHYIALPLTLLATVSFYLGQGWLAWTAPFALVLPVLMVWHGLFALLALSRTHPAFFAGAIIIGLTYPQWSGWLRVLPIASSGESEMSLSTWNVHHWRNLEWTDLTQTRRDMSEWIVSDPADILSIQDHRGWAPRALRSHYPHRISRWDLLIASKLPFIRSGVEPYESAYPGHEGFIWADIVWRHSQGRDTIRVANVHLVTTTFRAEDAGAAADSAGIGGLVTESYDILRRTAWHRAEQIDQIMTWRELSPYPVVLMGDFNDLPSGYSYHRARSGLRDAHEACGFGIGGTYHGVLGLPLRVDWIMVDTTFQILETNRLRQEWSDHDAVHTRISP